MTPEEKVKEALDFIMQYGNFDGDHHKMWVIDQLVRLFTGDKKSYNAWVRKVKRGEDGPNTYDWDVGIPP